jgi:hypothetical protein
MSIPNVPPVNGLPPVDPNDGGLPDFFNPNVPDSYLNAFSYPGDTIMSRLYLMVNWMQSHPANKTAPQEFLLFISNLKSKGVFQKYPELENEIANIKDASGKSIVSEIVDIEVEQNFYDGGSKDALFGFLGTLFGGSDEISQEVQDRLANWSYHWADFVALNTNAAGQRTYMGKVITAAQFNQVASGMWGRYIGEANVSSWGIEMRMAMIDQLSQSAVYKNNPLMLLMLLIFLLSDATTTNQISGYGETSNWLSKKTGDMTGITSGWSSTPFKDDGSDASAWIKKMEDLMFDVDNDPRASGIKGQIDSQLNSILNQQASGPNPAFDPKKPVSATNEPTIALVKHDGSPVTIRDLADGYTYTNTGSGDPGTTIKDPKASLATALNLFKPAPGGGAVPEQYQSIMNSLKGAGVSFADQSKTVGTMLSQLSSNDQAIDNGLNKALTSFLDLEKNCVQAQKST